MKWLFEPEMDTDDLIDEMLHKFSSPGNLLWLAIEVTAQSKTWTVFSSSNAGDVGSNATWCMDACVCFSMFLLSFVYVAALRRACLLSKDSYLLFTGLRD
jgi:hypothetical protein